MRARAVRRWGAVMLGGVLAVQPIADAAAGPPSAGPDPAASGPSPAASGTTEATSEASWATSGGATAPPPAPRGAATTPPPSADASASLPASPAGTVRLATAVDLRGRRDEPGARVFDYRVEVRPDGGVARAATLLLVAARPLAWTATPEGCAPARPNEPLRCRLGDLARPFRVPVSVRVPAEAVRKRTASTPDETASTKAPQGTRRFVAVAAASNAERESVTFVRLPQPDAARPPAAPAHSTRPVPAPSGKTTTPRPATPPPAKTDGALITPPPPTPQAPPAPATPRTPHRAPKPPVHAARPMAPLLPAPALPAPAAPDVQAPAAAPLPARPAAPAPAPEPAPALPAPAPALPAPAAALPEPQTAPGPEFTLPAVPLPTPVNGPPMDMPTSGILPTLGAQAPANVAGESQMTLISPSGTEEGDGTDWAVVLGITIVAEVGLLWLAACLGFWRRRMAAAGARAARTRATTTRPRRRLPFRRA
ncbi:hypothetical protein [Actinomadura parmotrematis]|uniref:DUF11 domain-containing protein n=1 Tax=Actinomadura parmotrematis TaxID=2864039 RepID=A0ABS7FRH1_9ACTN|nr:hypothetical protein [Actinomadura parmotrematis]MBW8482977.1 hypothetical protein [Actinomadura parmotrematis]